VSKKGGFWDNPFGGMFDFNGDGKEDFGEQFIGFKIFEECTKEDNDNDDYSSDIDFGFSPTKDYSWRQYVEVDYLLGIFPENYETEEEYLEAFNEAKYAWREYCEDGSEYGIDPEDYETEDEYNDALEEARESYDSGGDSAVNIGVSISVECPALDKLEAIKESDYPNKRRYNAAYTLANEFICYTSEECEKREKSCCKFIVENADTILAANYCSHDYGFLYAQAVKDNFTLPVSLPDEDETPEYSITQIITKIAKKDIDLALQVWVWLVENFLPYAHYTPYGEEELTFNIIDDYCSMPDKFKPALTHYLNDNPDFCDTIMSAHKEVADCLPELVCRCIQEQLFELATKLFKVGLKQANGDWKAINKLTDTTISFCKTYSELESIEYFQQSMLPLVKAINNGMVQDEIEEWEKAIAEYIAYIEKDCEQYAFTRKNAWRKTVPDGSAYGMDPRWYDSEEEYLTELNDHKYGWRKWYKDRDTLGLNVDDFETQDEYREAYNIRLNEKHQKQREERERERQQRQFERFNSRETIDDKTIYTLCGVSFPSASHPYHYKTDDPTIKIGDTVLVPVGDKEAVGTVISVGQYTRQAAPFPIERIKTIISKVEDKNNG
jgi:hypothetical protein